MRQVLIRPQPLVTGGGNGLYIRAKAASPRVLHSLASKHIHYTEQHVKHGPTFSNTKKIHAMSKELAKDYTLSTNDLFPIRQSPFTIASMDHADSMQWLTYLVPLSSYTRN